MMVVVGAFFTRIGVYKSWEESSEESSVLEQQCLIVEEQKLPV